MDGLTNETYIVFAFGLGLLSFYPIWFMVDLLKGLIKSAKVRKQGQENYLNKLVKNYYEDKNIFPLAMSDADFVILISDYLLGEHWFTTDSISAKQVNVKRAEAIILKYKRSLEK